MSNGTPGQCAGEMGQGSRRVPGDTAQLECLKSRGCPEGME